jgi:hypothetical protein
MTLVTLGIALFFGIQYPLPEPPPEDIVPLAANFTNPVDIEGTSSAAAPALTFQDDTDSGFFRSAADTINAATGGTERLEIDSAGFTVVPPLVTTMGTENVGSLPTVISSAITYESTGALWTVADGEIWLVHQVVCNITTNFDCTGDDCTVDIGDGNDADGLLDLDDAELQTSDTEGTGGTAGWQGYLGTDTRGAYFTYANSFVYAPSGSAETIDITVGGTSPAAGAGTCYLHYTRLQ